MVFPFDARNIDRPTEFVEEALRIRFNSSYPKLMKKVMDQKECLGFNIFSAELFFEKSERTQRPFEKNRLTHSAMCLCSLKFHLLDHMMEDTGKFRSLKMPESFPFERFNVHIKRA